MNKFSSNGKGNLSKKLKFISIASAVMICSTISVSTIEASASPVRNFFSRAWKGVRSGLRNLNVFRSTGSNSTSKIKIKKSKLNSDNILRPINNNSNSSSTSTLVPQTPSSGGSTSTLTPINPIPKPPRIFAYPPGYFDKK